MHIYESLLYYYLADYKSLKKSTFKMNELNKGVKFKRK